jgi:predicted branched-subunit amino acid permease
VNAGAPARSEASVSPTVRIPFSSPSTVARNIRTTPPWVDRQALRDVVPVVVSIVPFAMVIGVALGRIDIPDPLGVVASGLIYAGSAQLAAMELLARGESIVTALVTVAVINARMLMYGAGLEPSFRGQPRWFRWLAPQFIVDQTYALATEHPELSSDPSKFRRYWLTMGGAIGVVWLGTIGATLALGPVVHPESPLNFAATVLFVGMLVPKLGKSRSLAAAVGAALVATLGSALPNGIGLLAGVVAGMAAGLLADGRKRR